MRFSIVIPVFKTERFLPRCLDSLVAQTDGDFEAVVVDDCSLGDAAGSPNPPYQAEEIVARYDERFRYVRHEKNRSAFQARCTGVAAATGDYIVPVDPDDYLMPETLAKVCAVIDRDAPDLISYWMAYDDGKKVYPHWCRHPPATMTGVQALRELVDHKYFTGVASKALRRSALLEAIAELNAPSDLYINTCDDFLMLVPMLMKSRRVSFLDYAGYCYFVNEKSTSFSWKSGAGFRRARAQMRQANDLLRHMADQPSVSQEVRSLVGDAVLGIETWFSQTRKESSWPYRLGMRIVRKFLRR